MAYLALYRKYRPSGFDGLIGQDHIVKILKNQIKTDKIGHAYLFCGARGTGKTSAAKIFAKAINCLTPREGSPCGVCEVCRALANPNNMDILEIDAASNNRVDEVREIRDNVKYPPVNARYKVYIIDEVHMLTDSAFNALLKTLEEPPSHAVFILATTEPQKLLATILSRCMRFDFKLISEKEIAKLVAKIFDDVGVKYDMEAVMLIAKAGEGSVRDSLSIADKCVAFSEDKLTFDDVSELLGGADKSKVIALTKDMLAGNMAAALQAIDSILSGGKSVNVLCKDMLSVIRDLIVAKSIDGANEILLLPEERFSEYVELAEAQDVNNMLRCMDYFAKLEQDLKYSVSPRVLLEVTVLKCSKLTNDLSYDALQLRVNQLTATLQKLAAQEKKTPIAEDENEKKNLRTENAGHVGSESHSARDLGQEVKSEGGYSGALAGSSGNESRNVKKDNGNAYAEFVSYLRKSVDMLLFKVISDTRGEIKGDIMFLTPMSAQTEDMLGRDDVLKKCEDILKKLGYHLKISVVECERVESRLEKEADEVREFAKKLKTEIEIK